MITLRLTGDINSENWTVGLKIAKGNELALSVPKITPCGNARPLKSSTNVSTAPTSINTTKNHQLMQSTAP